MQNRYMARDVSPPRGMRDFLPADKAKRERALRIIRDVYTSHGFEEIETPVVEDFERLHSGLGGDNEKLAFSVLKRGLDKEALEAAANSGDAHDLADLGLRFDLTVPLARFYASHRAELPSGFRAIQIAPVWRAERPRRVATASSCSVTSTLLARLASLLRLSSSRRLLLCSRLWD